MSLIPKNILMINLHGLSDSDCLPKKVYLDIINTFYEPNKGDWVNGGGLSKY